MFGNGKLTLTRSPVARTRDVFRDHCFFQAEDGIRCLIVTGVQTCALPIFMTCHADRPISRNSSRVQAMQCGASSTLSSSAKGWGEVTGSRSKQSRAAPAMRRFFNARSEEHTSELQSRSDLVCRLLLEKKKK